MRTISVVLLLGLLLGGCTTVPSGPRVMVLPGSGKTFEQFQADDGLCRQWASQQVGKSPQSAAGESTATGAAVGTLVGAGLGAALGAASGHAGVGAAIGAGGGLLTGTAVGASAGQGSAYEVQRRYDHAYEQCMYAKGNQIPGAAVPVRRSQYIAPPPPPPPAAATAPPLDGGPPPNAAVPPPGTPPPR